jgi:outer membrane protein assembly factor BamB
VIWAATCGTISATGQYTAPATPATCEVLAQSLQDLNKSAKSTVTVSKVPVSISIQPVQASVYTNEQYSFSALISEATNKSVVWTATCGVVTDSGQYTAPSTPQSCEVKVSSVEDPSKMAVAMVTVLGVVVGIEPQVVNLEATDPKTAVFTASITGPNNKLVTWSTSQGTLQIMGNEATFQVPLSGDVFSITATSQLDPTKSATATVIIKTPIGTGVWANVPNWFTYQANELHNGFVPVTLNAKKFSKSWVQPFTRSLSPVVDGDGKFFVTSDKKLYCLNASTGQIEWTRDFSTVDSLDPPAYSNGKVYVSSGGHSNTFLWSLSANDGTTLFRSSFGNQWSRNYAPTPFKGNVYISGGYYGGSYGFNETSGDQLWFIPLNQYDEWTPAVDENYVYAYTGSYSPKLDVINRISGAIEYSIADPNFNWSGWSMNLAPVIGSQNDILTINNGRLIKFDLTNKKIAWELKSNFSGQVAVANGKIFALNNGEVQVRSETDGSLLWKWIPQGTTRADGTMVVVDNYLFVGAGDKTFAIDLNTQASVWDYNARGHLSLSNEGKL